MARHDAANRFLRDARRPVVWRMNTALWPTKDRQDQGQATPAEEERLNNQFSRWQLSMIISPEVSIIDVERERRRGGDATRRAR